VNENDRENVFHLADQEAEGGGEGGDGEGGVGGRMWGMEDRSGGVQGEREGDRGMADVALPPYRKV
jgi:hypothetical protein